MNTRETERETSVVEKTRTRSHGERERESRSEERMKKTVMK